MSHDVVVSLRMFHLRTCDEAAEEIERLRGCVATANAMNATTYAAGQQEIERLREALVASEAKYSQAAECNAGICRTLAESGEKRAELEQQLAAAEARQFSVGAKHLRDYAERVKERDECRRLLREACRTRAVRDICGTTWTAAARAAGATL